MNIFDICLPENNNNNKKKHLRKMTDKNMLYLPNAYNMNERDRIT
jgi:hypothetical protein